MLRAVLDTNVYVAGLLAPHGTCAELLRATADARFDPVVCPVLLDELSAVLSRPKFARRISAHDAESFTRWLARTAVVSPDPNEIPSVSPDANDDYLVALAIASGSPVLVSGDEHLLGLKITTPRVISVAAFAGVLRELP